MAEGVEPRTTADPPPESGRHAAPDRDNFLVRPYVVGDGRHTNDRQHTPPSGPGSVTHGEGARLFEFDEFDQRWQGSEPEPAHNNNTDDAEPARTSSRSRRRFTVLLVGFVVVSIAAAMGVARASIDQTERAEPAPLPQTIPQGLIEAPVTDPVVEASATVSVSASVVPSRTPPPPRSSTGAVAPSTAPRPPTPAVPPVVTNPPTTASSPLTGLVIGINTMCLDLEAQLPFNGTRIQLYPCIGSPAQVWTTNADNTLRAMGICIRPRNAGSSPGTTVEAWTCDGSSSQQWRFHSGTIENVATALCLTVPYNATVAKGDIVVDVCRGATGQRWTSPVPF